MRMQETLLVGVLLVSAVQIRAQTTTIDNVTIVDVTNGRLQSRKTIVIEGNRITRIDNASEATRAAATLDGTGMFVIPGLWDMHIHAYFTNDTARFHSTSEVMLPLFIDGMIEVEAIYERDDAQWNGHGHRDGIQMKSLWTVAHRRHRDVPGGSKRLKYTN